MHPTSSSLQLQGCQLLNLQKMDSPVSAISYLGRAKELCQSQDRAELIYAALELRCGVEARLREHAAATTGISKSQATQWEIKKLAKTVDAAFGLGDSFLIICLRLDDGRETQFFYAPVCTRLQEIAKRCGDYLHAMRHERLSEPGFWEDLKALLGEGCSLLELACSSEVLSPSFSDGLHFSLDPEDPRIPLIQALQAGANGAFSSVTFTPTGPLTFYPAGSELNA